ncbi:MAG: PocR ligand-binding domain-containing protein [Desulfobacterales bacterium]|nr:PocR ligand-binding domain-containing protein [Desulfobacterales bacterium]
MKLTDIAPIKKWTEIEDKIHDISGLHVSVFDIDGFRIIEDKNYPNKLCAAIKSTKKGQSFICSVAHQNIANQAMNSKKSLIEECDAGLLKLLVPIFVNGEFIGSIGGCGHILDGGEIDPFLISKTIDIDENEINKLSSGIPNMSVKKAESIINEIESLLGSIIC